MARSSAKFTVREFPCYVRLRDDVCYSFKFKEDAKGQEVMDEICNKLGIIEKDYFGLQYKNNRCESHWLNMRNKICRQLNKQDPNLLFCVKFYVQPHQLLQESSRQQFFLNVRYEILNGNYHSNTTVLPRLYALIAQVEGGRFKENHICYNPSRISHLDEKFCSEVIIEHCKLKDMSSEVAKFFCLKEVAELDDYGMMYTIVKAEDNTPIYFGIGIDSIQIERSDGSIQRIPFTCLQAAINSGKSLKLDIYTEDCKATKSIVYRLNSKEAACSLYRSITEHHEFYRCDSVRTIVKEQVSQDFFDKFLSWFHDDSDSGQNYIFDTERTCKEAYDHARRTLHNFGSTVVKQFSPEKILNDCKSSSNDSDLNKEVSRLSESLRLVQESFYCSVCRDAIVDIVLQCGHLICAPCSDLCRECPLCRTPILSKTKFYMPTNLNEYNSGNVIDATAYLME